MKRSAPLPRRTALSRTAMRRRPRRKRPKLDDASYIAWVKRQPCAWCGRSAPSDPHHQPGAGQGARSHDHEAIPMCREHHEDVTGRVGGYGGPFREWSREQRRQWHVEQVAIHRERYERRAA